MFASLTCCTRSHARLRMRSPIHSSRGALDNRTEGEELLSISLGKLPCPFLEAGHGPDASRAYVRSGRTSATAGFPPRRSSFPRSSCDCAAQTEDAIFPAARRREEDAGRGGMTSTAHPKRITSAVERASVDSMVVY